MGQPDNTNFPSHQVRSRSGFPYLSGHEFGWMRAECTVSASSFLFHGPRLDLWGDGTPELDPAVPGREREKGVETGSGVCSDLVNVGTYDVLPSSPWRRDLLRGPPRVYELPTIHPFFLSRAPRHWLRPKGIRRLRMATEHPSLFFLSRHATFPTVRNAFLSILRNVALFSVIGNCWRTENAIRNSIRGGVNKLTPFDFLSNRLF